MIREDAAFDAAFHRRTSRLRVRPETEADAAFLAELFRHCLPMAAMLPEPLLAMQSAAREASHRAGHPQAMRRVVTDRDTPVARFAIDWAGGHCHGIDIAVLPDARSSGAGLYLMRAWIDVADQLGKSSSLEVVRTNPAARLYARLGFVPVEDGHGGPIVAMIRPYCG